MANLNSTKIENMPFANILAYARGNAQKLNPIALMSFVKDYTQQYASYLAITRFSEAEKESRLFLLDNALTIPNDQMVQIFLSLDTFFNRIRVNSSNLNINDLVNGLNEMMALLKKIGLYMDSRIYGVNKLSIPPPSRALSEALTNMVSKNFSTAIIYYGGLNALLDPNAIGYKYFEIQTPNNGTEYMNFYQYLFYLVRQYGASMSPQQKKTILDVASIFEKTYSGYGVTTGRRLGYLQPGQNGYLPPERGGRKTKRRRMKDKTSKNKRRKTSKNKR